MENVQKNPSYSYEHLKVNSSEFLSEARGGGCLHCLHTDCVYDAGSWQFHSV